MKKIVITSTQWPYHGGAATNSYALIKTLRAAGHSVAGLFFTNEKVNVDPDKIGGVWKCSSDKRSRVVSKRFVNSYIGGRPDIIFGKNYAAPVTSKELWPKTKVIYLVTGSPHMIELSKKNISAKRYITNKKNKPSVFEPEKRCIAISDLVVPNSPIGKDMLVRNYGNLEKIRNPIDTSMALNGSFNKSIDFNKRKYDFTFICSNLNRSVKNAGLVHRLLSRKEFANHKKLIIGNNNLNFKSIKNCTVLPAMGHDRILKYLAETRVSLCSSFYDASPNIVKEAVMCGANVLMSENCGWSETYPVEFVVGDIYGEQEWALRMNDLSKNNIEFTITFKSDLVDKLEALI